MLQIILNRLKPQAEVIAEEQAGFRAGRSTTEQIFNLRILCEKYLQHQQDLYHVFICESWTLRAELQRRIQAMEMRCHRVTNEEVRAMIQQATGPHEDLLTIVKRRKLQWYGYVFPVHQVWPKPSCKAQ